MDPSQQTSEWRAVGRSEPGKATTANDSPEPQKPKSEVLPRVCLGTDPADHLEKHRGGHALHAHQQAPEVAQESRQQQHLRGGQLQRQ
eukprot:5764384-Pyramimonas_sp.AAC.2